MRRAMQYAQRCTSFIALIQPWGHVAVVAWHALMGEWTPSQFPHVNRQMVVTLMPTVVAFPKLTECLNFN